LTPRADTTSVAEQLREYFDDHGVGYRISTHEAAASADDYHAILGTRYEQMPKAIFLRYQGEERKGFAILALQAHKRAGLQRVKRVLTARDVRLGSRDELREVTGRGFGELPPVGGLFGLPHLFDQDLLVEDQLYFNAGSLTASMVARPRALEALKRPLRY
jgi:Ala-tRNA(Pro) deacylase